MGISKILTTVVFCGLMFSMRAEACSLLGAEYKPDPADRGIQRDHYDYRITVTKDGAGKAFTLQVIEPETQSVETRMAMRYRDNRSGEAPTLAITRDIALDIQLLNQKFNDVPAGGAEAPIYLLIHGSYAGFLNLTARQIEAEYLTDKHVIPGGRVNGRLELIPEMWVFNKCLGTAE